MLRQEELVQQLVDLQQAVTVDADEVAVHFQEAPVLEPLNWRGEVRERVRGELLPELRTTDFAQLELKDELADEPLVSAGRERAKRRKLAAVYAFDIGIELVVVLVTPENPSRLLKCSVG